MVGGIELQILGVLFVALRVFVALAVFEPLRAFLGLSGISILSVSLVPVLLIPESTNAELFSSALVQQVAGLDTEKLLMGSMQQVLLGFLLAAPLAIAFESLPLVGRITDLLRGTQFAEQVAPNLGNRVSALESLGTIFGCYLAFVTGGYAVLVGVIKASLADSGIYRQVLEIGFNGIEFVKLSAESLSTGVVIAAPVIVGAILFEFSLVVVSRFLPRQNLSSDLSPLKLICGLLLLGFVLIETSHGDTLFKEASGLSQNFSESHSKRLSHGQ